MRNGLGLYAGVAVMALQFASAAHGAAIWNNGGPALFNQGGSEMSDTMQAEDIQLSTMTNLTSISFWSLQFSPSDYNGSIFWQIVGDASGSPDDLNVIGNGTATPSQTADGTVLGFSQFRNDFTINLIGIAAGTYWLELHNGPVTTTAFTDFYWSWADLDGTNTGTNRGMENGLNPVTGWTTNDNEHAFNISGDAATAAPEPGTALLSFAAAGALAFLRGRKR